MDDPRKVNERCAANFSTDLFRQTRHVCVFQVGHRGLHFSDRKWTQIGEDWQTEAFWWGSDNALKEEVAIRTPEGVA